MKNSERTSNPCQSQHKDNMFGGFTKREEMAMRAMQGLLANSGGPIQHNSQSGFTFVNCGPDDVADIAFAIADSMMNRAESKS